MMNALYHYGTPQTRDGKGSGRYRKDWVGDRGQSRIAKAGLKIKSAAKTTKNAVVKSFKGQELTRGEKIARNVLIGIGAVAITAAVGSIAIPKIAKRIARTKYMRSKILKPSGISEHSKYLNSRRTYEFRTHTARKAKRIREIMESPSNRHRYYRTIPKKSVWLHLNDDGKIKLTEAGRRKQRERLIKEMIRKGYITPENAWR